MLGSITTPRPPGARMRPPALVMGEIERDVTVTSVTFKEPCVTTLSDNAGRLLVESAIRRENLKKPPVRPTGAVRAHMAPTGQECPSGRERVRQGLSRASSTLALLVSLRLSGLTSSADRVWPECQTNPLLSFLSNA